MLIHYDFIQNDNVGIQNRVYTTNKESPTHFSQFISVRNKKISGSVLGKVNKISFRQNDGSLIKKKSTRNTYICAHVCRTASIAWGEVRHTVCPTARVEGRSIAIASLIAH